MKKTEIYPAFIFEYHDETGVCYQCKDALERDEYECTIRYFGDASTAKIFVICFSEEEVEEVKKIVRNVIKNLPDPREEAWERMKGTKKS